jgi:photosystem II stability/assembly factor-like uncharacterized protein
MCSFDMKSFLYIALTCTILQVPSFLSAQWIQTSGPNGASVISFAAGENKILAATKGDLFLSADSGNSWHDCSPLPITNRSGISAVSIVGKYFLISINTFTKHGYFLYRSSDYGKSWELISDSIEFNSLERKDSLLFGATQGQGVLVSSDSGLNWQTVNNGLTDLFINKLAVCGDILFVTTLSDGVFNSANKGLTWNKNLQLPNNIKYFSGSGSTIFSSTSDQIYRTTNGGNSWEKLYIQPHLITSLQFVDQIVLVTKSGIYTSNDQGITWNFLTSFIPLSKISSCTAFGDLIFIGLQNDLPSDYQNDCGIYRSSNYGKSWESSNNGLTNTYIGSLVASDSSVYSATAGNGINYSTNYGLTWQSRNKKLPPSAGPLKKIGVNLITGTRKNGIYISTDEGLNWSVTDTINGPLFIQNLTTRDSSLYVIAEDSFYTSNDFGTNWIKFTPYRFPNNYAMCYEGKNIFASTFDGPPNPYGNILLSTNNGMSWERVFSASGNPIYSFAVIDTIVFAGTFLGLFRTTDHGLTWVKLTNDYILSFTVLGNNLFAGTEVSGVLLSTDFGVTWKTINEGLTKNKYIEALAVNERYLYAGTYGNGVWRRPLAEIIKSKVKENRFIRSLTAYPNPFSNFTSVKITNDIQEFVEILIVDQLGSKVNLVYSGMLNSGEYFFTWDARSVSSGIYTALVKMGEELHEIPIVLVK